MKQVNDEDDEALYELQQPRPCLRSQGSTTRSMNSSSTSSSSGGSGGSHHGRSSSSSPRGDDHHRASTAAAKPNNNNNLAADSDSSSNNRAASASVAVAAVNTTTTEYNEVRRSLHRRHFVAILALATLSIVGFVLLIVSIQKQHSLGLIINLSGRQRMLSQRPWLLLYAAAADGNSTSRHATVDTLLDIVDDYEREHRYLSTGHDPDGEFSSFQLDLQVEEIYSRPLLLPSSSSAAAVLPVSVSTAGTTAAAAGAAVLSPLAAASEQPLSAVLDGVIDELRAAGEHMRSPVSPVEPHIFSGHSLHLTEALVASFNKITKLYEIQLLASERVLTVVAVALLVTHFVALAVVWKLCLQPIDAAVSNQYQAQLAAAEAEKMADSAAAASAAKTSMMQTLAHEMRTPLQGIMGVASTAVMGLQQQHQHQQQHQQQQQGEMHRNHKDNDDVLYDSFNTILASSCLLLTLINNHLDMRKLVSNMLDEFDLEPVSVMECIRETVRYCEPSASLNETRVLLVDDEDDNDDENENKGGNSHSEDERDCWNVMASRLRLVQILINLLSNAIKYTNTGTDVTISVRQCPAAEAERSARCGISGMASNVSKDTAAAAMAGRQLEVDGSGAEPAESSTNGLVTIISIRDHGNGISREESKKLFREFSQLSVSAEKDRSYHGGGGSNPGGRHRPPPLVARIAQSSGSGLGLNLAMEFATRMNGHIWVDNADSESESGCGGAIFRICLPAAPPTATATCDDHDTITCGGQGNDDQEGMVVLPLPAPPLPEAPPSEGGNGLAAVSSTTTNNNNHNPALNPTNLHNEQQQSSFSDLFVMVVDDNMINLKVISGILKRLGVGRIETYQKGELALQFLSCSSALTTAATTTATTTTTSVDSLQSTTAAKDYNSESSSLLLQQLPNIILCDLQMPEMDGFQFITKLREQSDVEQQPLPVVLAWTADWFPDTESKCLSAGFVDIIRKPVTAAELKTTVLRHMMSSTQE